MGWQIQNNSRRGRNENFKSISCIYKIISRKSTKVYEEITVDNIVEEITACGKRWKGHLGTMGQDRWPKIVWNNKPNKIKEMLERFWGWYL
jgi:hypothetical protein